MTLTANVSLEIPTPRNMVRQMSEKPCFRGTLDRQQDKLVETMLQSERQHL